jgi:hypothetical protein
VECREGRGDFLDRMTESERSGERLPAAARRVSIANQFSGDYRRGRKGRIRKN